MAEESKTLNESKKQPREIILINKTNAAKASYWDVVERIAKVLSLIAVPIILGMGGWWIQNALSQRAVARDYVQLAVSILGEDESSADPALREWAVELLNANSPVPFTPQTADRLTSGELILPTARALSFQAITTLPATDPRRQFSRSIGRLTVVDTNGRISTCTAWLISTQFIMTADYCTSDDRKIAARVTFGYLDQSGTGQEDVEVEQELVEINNELGYAILKVLDNPGERWGTLPLADSEPDVGDAIVIIHHAGGRALSYSANPCRITAKGETRSDLYHNCDTAGGTGGAPIIRVRDMKVIGIHHSAARSATNGKVAKNIHAIVNASPTIKSLRSQ